MKTLHDLKALFQTELSSLYTPNEINLIFFSLAEVYLHKDLSILRKALHEPWHDIEKSSFLFFNALEQLKEGKPYQYVTGKAYFLDFEVAVTPDTLIPRPETEELIEWILEQHPKNSLEGKIIDLGTGSGILALALQRAYPKANVYGIDKEEKTIEIAKLNGQALQASVDFSTWDVFTPCPFENPSFDLMVSNPPYIPEKEKENMHKTVLEFEPQTALFVPDDHPLLFYQRIAELAHDYLTPNGEVYVEFHHDKKEEMEALFSTYFSWVETRKDISSNWRMLRAKKKVCLTNQEV